MCRRDGPSPARCQVYPYRLHRIVFLHTVYDVDSQRGHFCEGAIWQFSMSLGKTSSDHTQGVAPTMIAGQSAGQARGCIYKLLISECRCALGQ